MSAPAKTSPKPKISERPLIPEDRLLASPERDLCVKCGLWQSCTTPFMRTRVTAGWRESALRILLVGEAPGAHEDLESGRPFTGPAGQLLDRLCERAGLPPEALAYTNAARCRPKGNATPTLAQVRYCRPFLLDTLIRLRPRIVIALGRTAIRSLGHLSREVKVGKMRGHAIEIPGLPEDARPELVFATYHPSAALRGNREYEQRIVDDLSRAARPLMQGPKIAWPRARTLAVDTEYTRSYELLTLALASKTAAHASEWTDLHRHEPAIKASLKSAGVLVGHNLPVDLDHLVRRGWSKPAWITGEQTLDTMLLAKMQDENRGSGRYNLEVLAFEHADVMPWKNESEALVKSGRVHELPASVREERCRRDAHATLVLSDVLLDKLLAEYQDPEPILRFAHRVDMTLRRVWLAGAAVNLDTFDRQGQEARAEMERCGSLVARYAAQAGMPECSPTNDNHVRTLLYEKLGLETDRMTETGLLAVDKYTLKSLAHPVIEPLMGYRKQRKLLGVWYGTPDRKSAREPLAEMIEPAGLVGEKRLGVLRFRLRTLGTRTGRRASGRDEDVVDSMSHNAQNWPKPVRHIICSRWLDGKIGAFDYRKLEPRIIAWVSGDEWLMDLFTTGEGYIGIGRELWGKEVEEGTPQYTITKSTVLAAHYGAGGEMLAEQLAYKLGVKLAKRWERHVEACQALIGKYLKRAKGLRRYMRQRQEEVTATGQVVCPDGAIRHLPIEPGRQVPKHILNEAINAPIQRMAAQVTASALVDVEAALCHEHGLTVPELHTALVKAITPGQSPNLHAVDMPLIINEVHDEVTVDLPGRRLKRNVDLIVETMRAAPTLRTLIPTSKSLPLDVDPLVSSVWHGDKET